MGTNLLDFKRKIKIGSPLMSSQYLVSLIQLVNVLNLSMTVYFDWQQPLFSADGGSKGSSASATTKFAGNGLSTRLAKDPSSNYVSAMYNRQARWTHALQQEYQEHQVYSNHHHSPP